MSCNLLCDCDPSAAMHLEHPQQVVCTQDQHKNSDKLAPLVDLEEDLTLIDSLLSFLWTSMPGAY